MSRPIRAGPGRFDGGLTEGNPAAAGLLLSSDSCDNSDAGVQPVPGNNLQDSSQQRFDVSLGSAEDAPGWTWRLDYLNRSERGHGNAA